MEVGGKRTVYLKSNFLQCSDTFCDICKIDDKETKAEGLCEECEEYMCKACFDTHCKAKLCRHHKLANSGEPLKIYSEEDVENCKRHEKEIIKYYCPKHEMVGCSDCMIPKHVDCKPTCIKDLIKDFNENKELESRTEVLKDLLGRNETNAEIIQAGQLKNKIMKTEAQKRLKMFVAEIKSNLDKAAMAMEKEIEEIETENTIKLRKMESERIQIPSRITAVRQMLDKNLFRDSKLFIRFVESKAPLLEVERFVTGFRTGTIKHYCFVPNHLHNSVARMAPRQIGNISTKDILLDEVNEPIKKNHLQIAEKLKVYASGEKVAERFERVSEDSGPGEYRAPGISSPKRNPYTSDWYQLSYGGYQATGIPVYENVIVDTSDQRKGFDYSRGDDRTAWNSVDMKL